MPRHQTVRSVRDGPHRRVQQENPGGTQELAAQRRIRAGAQGQGDRIRTVDDLPSIVNERQSVGETARIHAVLHKIFGRSRQDTRPRFEATQQIRARGAETAVRVVQKNAHDPILTETTHARADSNSLSFRRNTICSQSEKAHPNPNFGKLILMPLSELSVSTQNYLKAIWSLEEWTEAPATASALAERMGLRVSSVSDGLKRLAAADLIDHQRYGAIELTPLGRTYAVAMIRRHRLIETFLVETLGYTWDRVHDEAEVLEHAVSDFMIERIDAILNHPTRDPHGDPIPDASGRISFPHTVPLTQCEPGERVILERITDSDPKLLRYLQDHGFVPGARLLLEEGAPFSEAVNVRVLAHANHSDAPAAQNPGSGAIPLGTAAAAGLFVSRSS